MSWLVTHGREDEVHVLPCDDDERIVFGHRPSLTCFCQPKALRHGPLDDPVWSHNEPSWPGAYPARLD